MTLKLGLVANPFAGLGGASGLKGSDGEDTVRQALARGAISKVAERVASTLQALSAIRDKIEMLTVPHNMGAVICEQAGWPVRTLDLSIPEMSSAEHTRLAVAHLQSADIDLLVFAGGDGTARDVFDAADHGQVVLGIPCGVKMHSGVFANNPLSAARIINAMALGQLVTVMRGEVRDIDEEAFRNNIVRAKYYGELWVPEELRYMQQVKSGGKEVEAMVYDEIAAYIVDLMEPGIAYFIGSGSTTASIMQHLGLENTLLGIDVVLDGELLINDAYEQQLFEQSQSGECRIVITAIGGQGHIFGRGNQQLSPRVLESVGLDNLLVVATKSKLEDLDNTLLVDTGDPGLDRRLSGYIRVTTGYDDAVLCPVRC